MIRVKNKERGQVIVLDLLLLLIIVILIISIEEKTINNYKLDIVNRNEDIDLLKESLIVEQLVSDCNLFAIANEHTKVCQRNSMEIKNINHIPLGICKITMDGLDYLDRGVIENTHKRGIVYRGKFTILEVGFCE